MKRYVKDIVGEEYKEWMCGDRILISTPTGSGKTTFVIETLLRYAMQQEKHVVYFCNRRVLHEQIEVQSEKKIRSIFTEEGDFSAEEALGHFHPYTYQNREACMPHAGTGVKIPISEDPETEKEIELNRDDILYYIFDEAHYFLADATLNSETNKWLDLFSPYSPSQNLSAGICVFLTATPELLYRFLNANKFLDAMRQDSLYQVLHAASPKYAESFDDKMTWFLEAISEDLQCARTTKVFEHNLGIGMKKLHPNELTDMYREFNSCVSDDRCFQYNYQEEPDYSYIQPVYFKEYVELLGEIRSTQKQKWLIFVDSEPAGMQFAQELKNAGVIGVGMISRNQINRSSEARKIYETIVEKEAFSQRILITTSVMDCGINIHDSMVKNIVIACDNKTGFLQMLGRKRIDEGENIRLFIKTYGYRTIQNRYLNHKEMLTVLNRFSLKNERKDIRDKYTGRSSGRSVVYLTRFEREKLHEAFKTMPQALYYKGFAKTPVYETYGHLRVQEISTNNADHVFAEFSYSRTAFLNVVTQMQEYEEALSAYHVLSDDFFKLCKFAYYCFERMKMPYAPSLGAPFSGWEYPKVKREYDTLVADFQNRGIHKFKDPIERDDAFYLKRQLAWMGLKYDENCWLEYRQRWQELYDYLAGLVDVWMDYDKQTEFAKKCLELLIKQPKVPDAIRADISRYKKGKLIPGKNKLNACFRELKLPFQIISVPKSVGGKRNTYWIVKRIDAEGDGKSICHTGTTFVAQKPQGI